VSIRTPAPAATPAPEALVEAIEDVARARRRNGVLVSEADYFVGAATALHAIGHLPPPLWYVALLGGRSVIDERDDLINRACR
jgi:hypothetical protein